MENPGYQPIRQQPQYQNYIQVGPDGRLNYVPLGPGASVSAHPPAQYPSQLPVMAAPNITPELYQVKASRDRWAGWVKCACYFMILMSLLNISFVIFKSFTPETKPHLQSSALVMKSIFSTSMFFVACIGLRAAKLKSTAFTRIYLRALIFLTVLVFVCLAVKCAAMHNSGFKNERNHGKHWKKEHMPEKEDFKPIEDVEIQEVSHEFVEEFSEEFEEKVGISNKIVDENFDTDVIDETGDWSSEVDTEHDSNGDFEDSDDSDDDIDELISKSKDMVGKHHKDKKSHHKNHRHHEHHGKRLARFIIPAVFISLIAGSFLLCACKLHKASQRFEILANAPLPIPQNYVQPMSAQPYSAMPINNFGFYPHLAPVGSAVR